MKLSFAALILTLILGAITVGWVYETKTQSTQLGSELEIPSDIDYFLTEVNYRVMNKAGDLDYELQTDYLEHHIRKDISLIDKPVIRVYRDQEWHVRSLEGEILHGINRLELRRQVVLDRQGSKVMQVRSNQLSYEPDRSLITGRGDIEIELENSLTTANEAVFDLKRKTYRLKNIKTIYYHENS